jgi:PAS domain S-box-containing protein
VLSLSMRTLGASSKFSMPDLQDPEIFRMVLDSLQSGVYVADRQGKILFWNQGAERLTGHKRHEVVGHPCRDNILVNCNDQGCVACGATCPFTQTLREGKPQEARMQLRHKEGHPVHVLMRIAPIRDTRGSIIGIAESFDEQKFASDRNQQTLAAYGCMDETTGLPNQEYTQFHLSENLATFARLINCPDSGVRQTWERIRKMVTYAGLQWWGDKLSVTTAVAYGSAQTGDTIDSLLNRAQASLQQSSVKKTDAAAAGSQATPGSSEI